MLRRTLFLLAGLAGPAAGARLARAQTGITPDPMPRLPPQPGQGLAAEDAVKWAEGELRKIYEA